MFRVARTGYGLCCTMNRTQGTWPLGQGTWPQQLSNLLCRENSQQPGFAGTTCSTSHFVWHLFHLTVASVLSRGRTAWDVLRLKKLIACKIVWVDGRVLDPKQGLSVWMFDPHETLALLNQQAQLFWTCSLSELSGLLGIFPGSSLMALKLAPEDVAAKQCQASQRSPWGVVILWSFCWIQLPGTELRCAAIAKENMWKVLEPQCYQSLRHWDSLPLG